MSIWGSVRIDGAELLDRIPARCNYCGRTETHQCGPVVEEMVGDHGDIDVAVTWHEFIRFSVTLPPSEGQLLLTTDEAEQLIRTLRAAIDALPEVAA